MKKVLIYVITIVLSIFVGFSMMYGLVCFFPNTIIDKVTKEEKTVNVVDNGIFEGINKVYNAVIVVEAYNRNGSLISTGSGFVYSKNNKNAYIMTNHHVIENANSVIVTFSDGSTEKATIKGSDEYADIAVLEVPATNAKQVASLGSSADIKLGDTVFTIGAPMGKEYAGTVTRGILSGKDRMVSVSVSGGTEDWIMNVMQTDAAINPGNSGGPLCNVNGEVVGVNSLKVVESSVEGLGFAIPIEEAMIFANKITSGEKISRAYIGVEMMNVADNSYLNRYGLSIDPSVTEGVVISNVVEGGPASEAGMQRNDIIVKVGNYDVSSIAELRYYLYKHNPGDEVEFKIYRGKESKTIKVTLGEI